MAEPSNSDRGSEPQGAFPGIELRRRTLLAAAGVLAASPALAAAAATNPKEKRMATDPGAAFSLAPLPYAPEALEPVIDAETMRLHHGKHHQAYVNNLNAALADLPDAKGKSLEDMFKGVGALPPAIRNNGGGHWNHTLFWTLMAKPGTGGQPSQQLAPRSARRSAGWTSSRPSSTTPA
jgi:Fe-Mn family superoxide dismutase